MQNNNVPLTEFMFYKAGITNIPLSGTFELSPVCNFSCKMCYVRKTIQDVKASPRTQLNLDDWLRIAKQAREKGLLYILLTGGEPLLWPDFWTLYEQLVKMGFLVSINTNGSLIDDAAIERFAHMPPRRINLTLYGASDESYKALCQVENGFQRVDNVICKLKAAGIRVKLNCSLTPDNVGDLEKIVEYAKQKDLLLQVADYMFPPIRRNSEMVGRNERFTPQEAALYKMETYRLQHEEEAYKEYLQSIVEVSALPPGLDENCIDPVDGKIRCRAGKSCFWITWDGWMMPCGMMNEPQIETCKRHFEEAWNELVSASKSILLSGICADCPNLKLCNSCASTAYAETGSFAGIPEYLCEMVQAMKSLAEEKLKNYNNYKPL